MNDVKIPDKIILDISGSIGSFSHYINMNLTTRLLDINELINGILYFICTSPSIDNHYPQDGLFHFLKVVESHLIEEEIPRMDIEITLRHIETIGLVLIGEFERLGFYDIKEFWGYQVALWLNPYTFILAYNVPYELKTFSILK